MTELTICMPVYNGEKYLDESIGSVLSQTYGDFKLLIYDDCSTDGSVAKIESFHDGRITIIRGKENRGGIYARTQLINALDTEYCMWIDDDDRFCRNDAVEDAMRLIKSGDYDMVNFARMYEKQKDGKLFIKYDGCYRDFSYCGDNFFEKFYPADNWVLFYSKIFKSEILKKSVPEELILKERFVTDDVFFAMMWYFNVKKYLHVYEALPIYEWKNDVGIWGSNKNDVSAERIGKLCILYYKLFLSLYNRINKIKQLSKNEYNSFVSGMNMALIPRYIANARKVYGNEYADNLVKIWHSAFGKDGVHLLNGINLFEMPGYIKALEDIMK